MSIALLKLACRRKKRRKENGKLKFFAKILFMGTFYGESSEKMVFIYLKGIPSVSAMQ